MDSIFLPSKDKNVATQRLRNIYREIQPDRPIAGGIYRYTQCEVCNGILGRLYDVRFGEWCRQALDQLVFRGVRVVQREYSLRCRYPLSILKRIVAMFFSINGEKYARCQPELSAFARDPAVQQFPSRYRFYAAFNVNDIVSHIPFQCRMNVATGRKGFISQIAHPPFVYVLTHDDEDSPDPRLTSLSHFTNYDYDDEANIDVPFRVVSTNSCFAGDYRASGKLIEDTTIIFLHSVEPSYFRIVDAVL